MMRRVATLLPILVAISLVGPADAAAPATAVGSATGGARVNSFDQQWSWPVGPPRAILRPFVAPATPYSAGHRGIDIAAPDGAVLAPAAGVVHFAGFVVDRPVLSIRHPGGLLSSFEPVASTLAAGDPVARGDPVGTVEAGHCATVCLHFGVRLHGEYVSPINLLGGIPHSVLLPTRWP